MRTKQLTPIKIISPQKNALKGALIFFTFSLAWILFSDRAAAYFISNVDTLTQVQSIKGILYISITSLLVYLLILRPLRAQSELIEQIQANESRLRAILDHSPALITIQDIEGKLSLFNKQFELVYCPPDQSLLNRPVRDIFPKEIAEKRTIIDAEVLKKGLPLDLEETLFHRDGTQHTYFTVKFLVALSGHSPYGICSVSTDISERVNFQRQLLEQQSFVKNILATTPNVIYVFDLKRYLHIFISESVTRAIGYSSDEVLSLKDNYFPQLVHEDDLNGFTLHHQNLGNAEDNEVFDIEYRLRHKNGEWRWFSSREIIFKRDESGVVESVIGISQDITRQKLAEKSLQEHQDKLRQTLDRLNESERIGKNGTWEFNYQTGDIWWSDSMYIIFDVPAHEKPTHDLYMEKIIPEDHEHVIQSFFDASQSTAEQAELTYRIKSSKDQLKYIWVNYQILRNEQGQAISLSGTAKDITEQKLAEDKIYFLAYYDELTNLPNRTLLLKNFRSALSNAQDNSSYGAVLQLDLDYFKTINECLGHRLGDILLKQVGQRIKSTQDETQNVYYVGGDEYYVLIPQLGDQYERVKHLSLEIAESVRQNISKPYYVEDSKLYLTASFGIIIFPEQETSADDLLKNVDIALSLAKKQGRNTIELYLKSFQKQAHMRLVMEIDLREAIEQEQFELYIQPQVNPQGRFLGAETLIRWQHPEHGMVSPNDFIPLAEQTGLIIPIGEKVLMMAAQLIKEWEQAGFFKNLLKQISVNVSPRQFHQDNFETYIQMVLKVSGINPRHLMLELTESVVIDNLDRTVEKMKQLKQLGIRFSMDDFGTGYSSLSYLRHLPFDELKIDRSFVMDISNEGSGKAIAESIISISSNLAMEVVAEGVELEQEVEFLQAHGCQIYQGYLFAKPMSVTQFNQSVKIQLAAREKPMG